MLFFISVTVNAAEFDTLITDAVRNIGLYDGSNGIIYAASAENGNTLALITIENDSFIISAYGSDNEFIDSVSFKFEGNNKFVLKLSDTDTLSIILTVNSITECYSLINDSFVLSINSISSVKLVAEYSNGKLHLANPPSEVYNIVNSERFRRISHIPYPEQTLSEAELQRITTLLKSCADIVDYSEQSDINDITRRILYTSENFNILVNQKSSTQCINRSLYMCDYAFISNAAYTAFRINSPKPAVNMFSDLKYCFNNNYYYFTDVYTNFFSTQFNGIYKTYNLGDNLIYIVFADVYTESGLGNIPEYSSAVIAKDSQGFYIKSLHMGDNFTEIPQSTAIHTIKSTDYTVYIPYIFFLFFLAVVGVITWIILI